MTTFAALYRLMLRSQVTRGRVLGLVAMGALVVCIGLAVAASGPEHTDQAGADLVNGLGLSLLVPVGTLLFASASLGDLREDRTMVYLWLRPVPAWQPVAAAWAGALTVVLPLTLVPLSTVAIALGSDARLFGATIAASTLGVAAYAGIFVWLGLRVRRSLVWGLAYVLIWEGFVATGGNSLARLALRAHTRSVLATLSGTELRLAVLSLGSAVLVPVAVALVALGMAGWRFRTQDVD